MVDVGFYHCTRMPAVDVAVRLLAKAYATGLRVLVTGSEADIDALDTSLWVDDPHSFLPHAITGQMKNAAQPILLVAGAEVDAAAAENGATLLLSLGQGLAGEFDRFERVLNLFEDGSDAHMRAREDWKVLGALSDVTRTYWQQAEGGGWEKKG